MREIESSYNMGVSTNNAMFNSANALQVRLDTNPILENIELFLRGSKLVVYQGDDGNITTEKVTIGRPLANELGVQGILNIVQLIMNSQVVQGNFATDQSHFSTQYNKYIFFVRIDLAQTLLENFYKWELQESDLNLIANSIMDAIEPFMTRLIGNKERESYANTITHSESNTLKDAQGGFSLFGKKI